MFQGQFPLFPVKAELHLPGLPLNLLYYFYFPAVTNYCKNSDLKQLIYCVTILETRSLKGISWATQMSAGLVWHGGSRRNHYLGLSQLLEFPLFLGLGPLSLSPEWSAPGSAHSTFISSVVKPGTFFS